MTVDFKKNGSALTVAVGGRLDTVTAPELEGELSPQLDGINNLVLDFSGLDYISSAGLRVLLTLHKLMLDQGKMKVTGIHEAVFEIFEVTGFSDILDIEKA